MLPDDIHDRLIASLRQRGRRVVFPEGDEPRIQQAARRLVDEGLAHPVLVGNRDHLEASAARDGRSLAGIASVDPLSSARGADYAAAYRVDRPKASSRAAHRVVRKPLFHAALMVKTGDADAMVAGAAQPTARVIEAGLLTIGLAPRSSTVSSFFLMAIPASTEHGMRFLIFADCAVNVTPTARQLADITIASAASAEHVLGVTPRVALLSYSTHSPNQDATTDRIKAALAMVREQAPALAVDGELQADTALSPEVAARKCRQSSDVAGHANVLIFPDLNAGNIAYKLVQHLSGGQAFGPFLQGFARPVSDLSRGASVAEIVLTAAITLALA